MLITGGPGSGAECGRTKTNARGKHHAWHAGPSRRVSSGGVGGTGRVVVPDNLPKASPPCAKDLGGAGQIILLCHDEIILCSGRRRVIELGHRRAVLVARVRIFFAAADRPKCRRLFLLPPPLRRNRTACVVGKSFTIITFTAIHARGVQEETAESFCFIRSAVYVGHLNSANNDEFSSLIAVLK